MKLPILPFAWMISALVLCTNTRALTVTSWNLEHLQSENDYLEWVAQCATEPNSRPAHMTFCGALDGRGWTHDTCDHVKGSDISQDIASFREKIATIRSRLVSLDSDVFAFQELNSEAALRQLFAGINGYTLFASHSDQSNLHVGFAIKSSLIPIFSIDDRFAVDTCNTPRAPNNCADHISRPGLEATIETNIGQIKLLNLHLKSGCQTYALDGIQEAQIKEHICEDMNERFDRIITGCRTLRKQIPLLEAWLEEQAKAEVNYLMLGDFNRRPRGDLLHAARLDDTDRTESIMPTTKIGSMIKEISDGDPANSAFIIAESKLDTTKIGGYDSCWTEIDWIAIGDHLADQLGWSIRNRPVATGKDFRPYLTDKAMASDHCPVTLEIPGVAINKNHASY